MAKVILVDDEPSILSVLSTLLSQQLSNGFTNTATGTSDKGYFSS